MGELETVIMETEQRVQKVLSFLDTQEGHLIYWVNECKGVNRFDNLCGIIKQVFSGLDAVDIFAVYRRVDATVKEIV